MLISQKRLKHKLTSALITDPRWKGYLTMGIKNKNPDKGLL